MQRLSANSQTLSHQPLHPPSPPLILPPTNTGVTIRAPAPKSYWAPELLRGESGPTKAADMFAYAMLMYKLLAKGVAPFGQGMTMQVRNAKTPPTLHF